MGEKNPPRLGGVWSVVPNPRACTSERFGVDCVEDGSTPQDAAAGSGTGNLARSQSRKSIAAPAAAPIVIPSTSRRSDEARWS